MRAAFPLSKSLLVSLTDPYHGTNAVQTAGYTASLYIAITNIKNCNKKSLVRKALIDIGASLLSNELGFAIVHDGIFHS